MKERMKMGHKPGDEKKKIDMSGYKPKNLLNDKLMRMYKTSNGKNGGSFRPGKRKRNSDDESDDDNRGKRRKKEKSFARVSRPALRYSNVGGMEDTIEEIRKLIHKPFERPDIYKELRVQPVRGVLFHGPPGCGKTMLANAIAGELGVAYFQVTGPQMVFGMSGESEAKIRTLFQTAVDASPSLIFIDEIDVIMQKRDQSTRGMEKRIVAQLCSCMDGLDFLQTEKLVMVLGATNRPDSIDPALRRAGRFDKEIVFGIPGVDCRERILRTMLSDKKVEDGLDFKKLSKLTPGYVGADVTSLIREASSLAIDRIFNEIDVEGKIKQKKKKKRKKKKEKDKMRDDGDFFSELEDEIEIEEEEEEEEEEEFESPPNEADSEKEEEARRQAFLRRVCISMDDFERAIPQVQPSSKREGFATVPDVSWSDIGALERVREELELSILKQIHFPELYAQVGLTEPVGILLFGPPGCGKTLLAKAVANDSHANFLCVRGPELLNKYVGETERAVRTVFLRARSSAPCVIFFDELDALCSQRSKGSTSKVNERVVNQLLTEMDGMGGPSRKDVYVIAATNRVDMIDPAMLRPGRLDKLLYVPLPDLSAREKILRTVSREKPLGSDVDLKEVAKGTERFSGADLKALVREACMQCIRRKVLMNNNNSNNNNNTKEMKKKEIIVNQEHFREAMAKIRPSVSVNDEKRYQILAKKYGVKKL